MDINTNDVLSLEENVAIEKLPPTGDKLYNNNVLLYSDDPTNISFEEEITIIDKNLNTQIAKYTPSTLYSKGNWSIITLLLSFLASKVTSNAYELTNVYNIHDLYTNETKVKELATLFDINYPKDYTIEQLALLVKVWPKIYDRRGEEISLKMLYRVIDRTERDLYLDDSDDTLILQTSYGNFNIIYNTRVQHIEFAKELTKRLLPAGRGFRLNTQGYIREYSSAGLTYIFNDTGGSAQTDTISSQLDTLTMRLDSKAPLFLVYEIGDVVGYNDF